MTKIHKIAWEALRKLSNYIESEDYRGHDPYDALNSPFSKIITLNNRYLRIIFTQAMRRLPVNLRPLLKIEKGLNPKGLALLLAGYVKLLKLTGEVQYQHKIMAIAKLLDDCKSSGFSGVCWGYNFPWQNHSYLFPAGTPTIVNTSFIGHAFLDAYELLGENAYLQTAADACIFIMRDLHVVHETQEELCLSYTPLDCEMIYNSNALGASLLARVHSITHAPDLLKPAKKMIRFVANAQREDGSWLYGPKLIDRWVDIHHTGFVLDSLHDYARATGDRSLDSAIERGLAFFERTFFLPNGRPRQWNGRDFPTNIHSVQAIVTLAKLHAVRDNRELLERIATWILTNMQDPAGYFYYQKGRFLMNKIPYMRWSQAWAFHALTTFCAHMSQSDR